MRFYEILEASETHHALTPWRSLGSGYEVAFDTHGISRVGERGVSSRTLKSILHFAFSRGVVRDIPKGTSSYIHDSNSGCSVVIERLRSYPFRFIVRTVMSEREPPGNPRITVAVPAPTAPATDREKFSDYYLKHLGDIARERGVDAASQAVASGQSIIPLNREQRRAIAKAQRKGNE